MGRATNRSAGFTASNVCWPGFWRHWGVWGERSPRSFFSRSAQGLKGLCSYPSSGRVGFKSSPPSATTLNGL